MCARERHRRGARSASAFYRRLKSRLGLQSTPSRAPIFRRHTCVAVDTQSARHFSPRRRAVADWTGSDIKHFPYAQRRGSPATTTRCIAPAPPADWLAVPAPLGHRQHVPRDGWPLGWKPSSARSRAPRALASTASRPSDVTERTNRGRLAIVLGGKSHRPSTGGVAPAPPPAPSRAPPVLHKASPRRPVMKHLPSEQKGG